MMSKKTIDGWNKRPVGWEEYEVFNVSTPILPYLLQKQIQLSIKRPDMIIVLAGGLDDKGEPHLWVKRRLDLAVQIYKQFNDKLSSQNSIPIPIICTGGGTYHKPPFSNKNGFVVHEATACAEYLIKNGINSSKIYKEWSSYDTIANAYFTFLMHILPQILEQKETQIKNIVIVTSDFHMARCEAIFKWVFSLFRGYTEYISLNFVKASDDGLDKDIIGARCIREKNSLYNLYGVIEKINTKEKLHEWIYSEHQAYSCRFDRSSCNEKVDSEVQKSY